MFATGRYRLSEATTLGQMSDEAAVYYSLATAGRSTTPFVAGVIKDITSVFDGTAKPGSIFLRRDEDGHQIRHRQADLLITEDAITGPAKVHANGRPYAAGLRVQIATDHTPESDQVCLDALARLREIAPTLKPAHPE